MVSPRRITRRRTASSDWDSAANVLESPTKNAANRRRKSSGRATSRSPKNNRRHSTILKRLDTDVDGVSFSPRRTRRKSMGLTSNRAVNQESKIPKSTSEGQLKKTALKRTAKTQVKSTGIIVTTSHTSNSNNTNKKNPQASQVVKKTPPKTVLSNPTTNGRPMRRGNIIRRPSLLELEAIDLNPKVVINEINSIKRSVEKTKSSSTLSSKENVKPKIQTTKSKSQVISKIISSDNKDNVKSERKLISPKINSSRSDKATPLKKSTPQVASSPKLKRLTRSAVKSEKRVKIFSHSPLQDTVDNGLNDSNSASVTKPVKKRGKPFTNTPKPPTEPSKLLKQTMKQKFTKEMQAIKRVTSKVDIQRLMDTDIVSTRLPLKTTKTNGTPQLVSIQHDEGSPVPAAKENIPCLPSTPVSSANLPPTPKSSQRRIGFSYSRIKKCHGSMLNNSPLESNGRRRSSTPIDDDDEDFASPSLQDPNITDISKVSASDVDTVSKVPEVTAPSVEDSNKRSYCSLM